MVRKNKLFIAGILIILFFTIIAIFAPIIAPYDPAEIDLLNILNPPSQKNLFGTDDLGRDVLKNIRGIEFIEFSEVDVVRNPIVQKIIKAYERYENK